MITVLTVAASVFAGWAVWGPSVARAVEATVAVLVVTCPCALGIAAPLAYELSQAELRRRGVIVRSQSFLDRAAVIRKVIFDKTGTLTHGELRLVDRAPLDALSPPDRHALFAMVARSRHPKSRLLADALSALPLSEEADVEEVPGLGMRLRDGSSELRLGSRSFVASAVPGDLPAGDLFFSRDEALLAAFSTEELVPADSVNAIRRLTRAGVEVHLLSGTIRRASSPSPGRLGLDPSRVHGGKSSHEKEAYVAALDQGDTMMLGDGVNDVRAANRAHASGTPALDLPFLPARTDFCVEGRIASGAEATLREARLLRVVLRENLLFALSYNVLAVALSAAGVMSPLLCAVVMPLSSIMVVGWTVKRSGRDVQRGPPTSRSFAPSSKDCRYGSRNPPAVRQHRPRWMLGPRVRVDHPPGRPRPRGSPRARAARR